MEKSEVETSATAEEGSQLNRNRSFKSKQLVRSQAIRESTSPPRTVSPSVRSEESNNALASANQNARVNTVHSSDSNESDGFNCNDRKCEHAGKQRVEIQITSGTCPPSESWSARRGRRWAEPRDLLSNSPRVACVCGACSACPHCRGRKRRHKCPTKQDSGIVCSDECPDCTDDEQNGSNDGLKKSASGNLETDDQYYCRCAERKDKPKSISLSRTDSDDKSEPVGPELVAFIKDTLNKNARDRTTLLKIERELHCFINDPGRCIVKFPVMTSYGRMLVHRCASLFQLAHHLDQNNKTCVVVSKSGTCGGRIPCTSFRAWCTGTLPPSPLRHSNDHTNAKSILKRDTHSLDEPATGASAMSRSRSLEQRERDYERVRRRIFSSDNCSAEESQWPWLTGGAPVKLLTAEPARNKLLKVQSLEGPPTASGGGGSGGAGWRSGGAVSKSHSFGGYGDQAQTRALSRQGDLASSSWRLSPSSSGYKTLSLRSTDSVTPSPTGGGSPEPAPPPGGPGTPGGHGAPGALVWAVTDLAAVPRGALVLHPQTGRPLTNPDGSLYHFDPANPPLLYDAADKTDQYNEKRRGRLEKQDSFMDNDIECQSTDGCRSKCCCECRKHEQAPEVIATQTVEEIVEKETEKPPANPIKTYDQPPTQNHAPEPAIINKPPEPTNHKPPEIQQPDASTNQRYESQAQMNRSYELANQREAVKMMSQDMVHYNQPYAQMYSTEEMTSPHQINPYIHQDMSNMQNMHAHMQTTIPQAKAQVAIQDPNIRPLSITNMMYPAIQPGYQTYIPNHRMDQIPQQMYQPMMQQQIEEPKTIPTPPQHENTFRIDPSYPFPTVDYAACCDPTQLHQQQRSYSVPYSQVEVPPMQSLAPPAAYPLPANIILPPTMPQYPVQYQPEPVQWAPQAKLYEVCPLAYPHHYAYTMLYPQVVQPSYPVCQPLYPTQDPKPEHPARAVPPRGRVSLPPTPLPRTPDDKRGQDGKELHRQTPTDIAVKIQQIKEQMASLQTRAANEPRPAGRRNSGHGILGSCPAQHYAQGRANEDNQLSSAARAIINSLRNMQPKNTYHQDRRQYEPNSYARNDRAEYGNSRRRERDGVKQDARHSNNTSDRQDVNGKGDADRKYDRNRVNQVNLPYRPPYLFRQVSPGTWCRRSPAPIYPALNQPRRPHPDTRPRR